MTALLSVRDLLVELPSGGQSWRARATRVIDGVSLSLDRGEVLAVVGESGCGKTTLARAIAGLLRPTGGSITFQGRPIDWRQDRSRIQMILQDPFDSLNPRKVVGKIVAQPLANTRQLPRRAFGSEVARLLELVGLTPPERFLDRRPHQLSGGERQRVSIARSLATSPDLLIADEAVSALDVSVRAQVLGVLRRLQRDLGLSLLFITHDLGVVRSFADRISVMYLGKVLETGPVDAIFGAPRHPYTLALLAATPIPDPARARARQAVVLEGEPASHGEQSGCVFASRCPMVQPQCQEVEPPARVAGVPGHQAACHYSEEVAMRYVDLCGPRPVERVRQP